jgi:hypothetical protein
MKMDHLQSHTFTFLWIWTVWSWLDDSRSDFVFWTYFVMLEYNYTIRLIKDQTVKN